MKYSKIDIVFQEVPNEISLAFFITGCPMKCKNCHSSEYWNLEVGDELTDLVYLDEVNKYKDLVTTVLFFGGEWEEAELIHKLKIVRAMGLNTCLYTGKEDVSDNIKRLLTYLKTGPYIESLGGLDNPNTNQVLINVKTKEVLNEYFL